MNKKVVKKLSIVAIVGLIIGLGAVYYIFNMPHRNIKDEAPTFKIEAKTLFAEYSNDEDAGNVKFGDKVIQVSGKIVEIAKDGNEVSFVLNDEMEGVNCSLDSMMIVRHKGLVDKMSVGNDITVKGKCDGFDMIMGVVLTQCFVIEHPE